MLRKSLIVLALVMICVLLAKAENYAVLIQGCDPAQTSSEGGNWNGYPNPPPEGYDEFWNDTFLWWEALWTSGWKNENIHVLFFNGADWLSYYNPRYRSADRYGQKWGITSIVDDSATNSSIERTFNNLAQVMTNEDLLFVYIFGDGWLSEFSDDHSGFQTATQPWVMWDTTFARIVDQCAYHRRVFCLEQCYSGNFIPDLLKNHTYIMTAADSISLAYRADDVNPDGADQVENDFWWGDSSAYHHGEMDYHAFNALLLKTIVSNPLPEPDKNYDGRTSCKEIWQWVDSTNSHYPWYTTQQAADSGGIADSVFLNIPPYKPTGLAGQRVNNHVVLTWNRNHEYDLADYEVYKRTYRNSTQEYSNWYLLAQCDTAMQSYTDTGFIPTYSGSDTVWYKLAAMDSAGQLSEFTSAISAPGVILTQSLEGQIALIIPDNSLLLKHYPEPFNQEATIQFNLPQACFVTLNIFDITGRNIVKLIQGYQTAGSHKTTFNGRLLASGIYLCHLETGGKAINQKLVLLK